MARPLENRSPGVDEGIGKPQCSFRPWMPAGHGDLKSVVAGPAAVPARSPRRELGDAGSEDGRGHRRHDHPQVRPGQHGAQALARTRMTCRFSELINPRIHRSRVRQLSGFEAQARNMAARSRAAAPRPQAECSGHAGAGTRSYRAGQGSRMVEPAVRRCSSARWASAASRSGRRWPIWTRTRPRRIASNSRPVLAASLAALSV